MGALLPMRTLAFQCTERTRRRHHTGPGNRPATTSALCGDTKRPSCLLPEMRTMPRRKEIISWRSRIKAHKIVCCNHRQHNIQSIQRLTTYANTHR